jgi:transglutaminase-like putative cysteine protease
MIVLERTTVFWVMATFAAAVLPQLVRMPPAVAALTLAAPLWRLVAEFRGWKPLPALVRHAVTGTALATLFFSYGDISGRRAAVSLLALMLALKFTEAYRIRDARLVVSFSLFLCATQFLFTQGILMAVYGLASVIIGLISLTWLQRSEAWVHCNVRPPRMNASLLSELGFGLKMLALAVPIGLAFFVLFPRLASPIWGIPETTLDSKTGLSDSMSPGSIQQLFMDDSPAFRATFERQLPGAADLYWRGPVFWRFDGRSWTGSFYGTNIEASARPPAATAPWDYRVQIEPNERKWLFTLDYPAIVPDNARLTLDYQLIRRDPVLQLMEYRVVSDPRFVDSPDLLLSLQAQALELPEGSNPETRRLVERWRQETPDDDAFVRRVLNHFNQEPFRYSLDSPLLGRHSVDEFLFETRIGFCEHYASAFAVMMRMAGIPARIVTGYLGGWYNPVGEYYLVRQSDAHAWVEIWQPATGWTRIDPTAAVSPLRVQQGSFGALSAPRHLLDYRWLRQLRNRIDVVQQRWNDWVIEYGANQQARLFEPLGLGRASPVMLVSALFVSLAVLGAALLPFVLRIRGPGRGDPAKKAWQRFLKRLAKAGFASRACDGPLELAEAASVRLPRDAAAIRRVADLYSRYRYASQPPPLQQLLSAVREFRPVEKCA